MPLGYLVRSIWGNEQRTEALVRLGNHQGGFVYINRNLLTLDFVYFSIFLPRAEDFSRCNIPLSVGTELASPDYKVTLPMIYVEQARVRIGFSTNF